MSDLPGPLRSEAAAFRVLVWCIVVLAAIALVAVLVRALS
jgi:hypothetical protein